MCSLFLVIYLHLHDLLTEASVTSCMTVFYCSLVIILNLCIGLESLTTIMCCLLRVILSHWMKLDALFGVDAIWAILHKRGP